MKQAWGYPEIPSQDSLPLFLNFPAATTAEPASMGITGTAASAPQASLVQTAGSVSINPASQLLPDPSLSRKLALTRAAGPSQSLQMEGLAGQLSVHWAAGQAEPFRCHSTRPCCCPRGETGLAGQQLISHALWHWLHRLFSLLKAFRWPHSFPLQTLCSAKSSL